MEQSEQKSQKDTASTDSAPPAGAGTKPRGAVKKPRSKKPAKKRAARRSGMSGLDAAAKVLAEVGKPMRCSEIMERIRARGLWKTSGKTPAATINAAMIREIKSKGRESRFKKAGRGLFAAGARPTAR